MYDLGNCGRGYSLQLKMMRGKNHAPLERVRKEKVLEIRTKILTVLFYGMEWMVGSEVGTVKNVKKKTLKIIKNDYIGKQLTKANARTQSII